MRRAFLYFLLAFPAACAIAAPSEIKVFTDELARDHEHTLEVHANRAHEGPLRLMPEYSYGIARDWEASLQLPIAHEAGSTRSEGYRVELQYIAPHDEHAGWYWGFNSELAREDGIWNVELIGIVGWRHARWHFVVNPGAERALSGPARDTSRSPAAKAAYRVGGRNDIGVELYRARGGNMAFLAWDGKLGRSDINIGAGHGTAPGDRWILKAICEIAF